MILSRFWTLLLAAAAAAAVAAGLAAQSMYNRQHDSEVRKELSRDRVEMELWMRMDARARIDAIAPIAAHSDVRSALRKVSARGLNALDSSDTKELDRRLKSLNEQLEELKGDLLFAVDDSGTIVSHLGQRKVPKGASLGAFPLVERALAGYVRDDVWVYNDAIYRMAARPVIDAGQYVGAIIHGKSFDQELAQRLGQRLRGASIAFFFRDKVLASHTPALENAARASELEGPLKEMRETLTKEGRTDPTPLGETAHGIYALVSGSAAHASVGYAIARPRQPLTSPFAIFAQASKEDWEQWPIPASGGAVLFLLGMLWLYFERDRPFSRFRRATDKVAKKQAERLTTTDFGGAYRKLAERVNAAIDRAVEDAAAAGPRRKPANLDEILGPTPEGAARASGPGYFGFRADEKAGGVPDMPDVPPAPPAGGMGMAPRPSPAAPPAAGPALLGQDLVGAPPPGPPTPKAMGGPPRAPNPVPGPGRAPGMPGAPPPRPPAAPDPAPRVPPPAAAPMPQHDFPDLGDEDDEGATMVSQVPAELLAQAGGEDEEEAHFREVYEKFTAKKRECGESTSGLSYEKFSQTLRKNRDQIVMRHGAKKVRFTVYTKEGKAALKATPVRE